MSKGSNKRPLSVPREQFDKNFDRIFRRGVGKPNSPERDKFIDEAKELMSELSHDEQLEWLHGVQERARILTKREKKPDRKREKSANA